MVWGHHKVPLINMKYVISDKGEVSIGVGFHDDLAKDFIGKVVRAGHCEKLADGTIRVWGMSYGFRINAKPEDARILSMAGIEIK